MGNPVNKDYVPFLKQEQCAVIACLEKAYDNANSKGINSYVKSLGFGGAAFMASVANITIYPIEGGCRIIFGVVTLRPNELCVGVKEIIISPFEAAALSIYLLGVILVGIVVPHKVYSSVAYMKKNAEANNLLNPPLIENFNKEQRKNNELSYKSKIKKINTDSKTVDNKKVNLMDELKKKLVNNKNKENKITEFEKKEIKTTLFKSFVLKKTNEKKKLSDNNKENKTNIEKEILKTEKTIEKIICKTDVAVKEENKSTITLKEENKSSVSVKEENKSIVSVKEENKSIKKENKEKKSNDLSKNLKKDPLMDKEGNFLPPPLTGLTEYYKKNEKEGHIGHTKLVNDISKVVLKKTDFKRESAETNTTGMSQVLLKGFKKFDINNSDDEEEIVDEWDGDIKEESKVKVVEEKKEDVIKLKTNITKIDINHLKTENAQTSTGVQKETVKLEMPKMLFEILAKKRQDISDDSDDEDENEVEF